MAELTSVQRRQGGRFKRLIENPVAIKELRSRMRGRRAFVVLSIYLLLMSALITFVYLLYALSANSPYGADGRQAGKMVFITVLIMQSALVLLVGPALTAGAISGEKERQTYDLLRTTLLSANAFVMGKLTSALSYIFLLIFAAVPLQSIAFLLGGVALVELFISQLVITVSAITYALLGLFFSSRMRSTIASTVSTFAISLFVIAGIPTFAVVVVSLTTPLFMGISTPGWFTQISMIYTGLLLAATNMPLTLIISEIFLLQQGTLFYFTELIDGRTVYIFSPWPVYTLLYTLLSFILYWATVYRVRQISDR